MTRAERAVLLLLCIFAVKFVCSTVAHFVPALQGIDMLGSGRHPVDVWLLLLSCTAVLGTWCLYRRAAKALDARLTKFDAVVLAICIAASAAFYLHAMVGRQSLYLWDNATYYNLQIRLESNFADGVFTGVGSTIYKTWFNDYAPLVINLLAEPFFVFTPRTANTFALLCGLLVPTLVYYSAWVLLAVLRRQCRPKAPRLFTALGLAMTTLLPLLHIALYRGMPDLLGVAFALMLLALGIALAGVLLNQHFLVLSGGISRTEIQSPLGDLVRSHLQLVALIVFATLAAAILALYHYKKQPELRYFLLYLAVLFSLYNFDFPITNKHNCLL